MLRAKTSASVFVRKTLAFAISWLHHADCVPSQMAAAIKYYGKDCTAQLLDALEDSNEMARHIFSLLRDKS